MEARTRIAIASAIGMLGLLGLGALLLLPWGARAVEKMRGPTGLAAIQVPQGFRVEKVAGPGLSAYPMMGTLDDRGRLFVCESSGDSKVTNAQMAAHPTFLIRMLEDVDGDGVYDRSTVFADKLTLPAGAEWYRGSLYVASPPDLFRFDDTNGDGVADRREVIASGWNLSSNAASLHGPFLGPDGWLYLTDGRHGYKIRTKEGPVLEGKASRIWRLRPDGTGVEWVSGGGFDNPVELVFTAAGEIIGTMTYFTDPKNGERDALLHFVEGGVYPKPHPVVGEFKRTGDLMPVMTKFARIAPAGLLYYRGTTFGREYDGNLFSAHFNSHRIERHRLIRDGATFRTEDEDFLTSTDPDFHPTDVLEDADGSLLVIDTGAWFIHGCPLSRIAKPQIKGAIYRVRKADAPPVADPRGRAMRLEKMPPAELARHLGDSRFAVRDRALDLLVEAGEAAVMALSAVRESSGAPEVRCAAVFGLARIGTARAQEAVRAALGDADFQVRVAAARAAGMARDRAAMDRLMEMAQRDEPAARRQAATALGQIGDPRATPALLAAAAGAGDRFIEHAVIYALISLGDAAAVAAALKHPEPEVRKAALIALDQMDGAPLRRKDIGPFLNDSRKELRAAALWVVAHHPDWSGEVLAFLRAQLSAAAFSVEAESVREVLISSCADSAVQNMVAVFLGAGNPAGRQLFLLDTIDRCSVKEFPAAWLQRIGALLDRADVGVRTRAVQLIRSRGLASLDDKLEGIANDRAAADDLRAAALSTLISRHRRLAESDFQFLLGCLEPNGDATLRLSAAQVLGRAALDDPQLLALAARHLPQADPLILPSLLDAFRSSKSEQVGSALVGALLQSPVSFGDLGARGLGQLLKNYPQRVRSAAAPLVARLKAEQKSRIERLQNLEPLLTGGGDVGHGRRIFFGQKVACSRCHTIGAEGGQVGPDLTAVGAIRSGHDLLEAIVFPSASFVPGFEAYRVETTDGTQSGIIVQRTPDTIVLLSGPNDQTRIPRSTIVAMNPASVSLMPEGLDRSLTATEFRDLLAFLQAQKSRDSAP